MTPSRWHTYIPACSCEDPIVAALPTEHHTTTPAVVLAIQHAERTSTARATEHLWQWKKKWLDLVTHYLSFFRCHSVCRTFQCSMAVINTHWPSPRLTRQHLHSLAITNTHSLTFTLTGHHQHSLVNSYTHWPSSTLTSQHLHSLAIINTH